MNEGLSKFIIFATGAAIGSVVTWKLLKDKYERIAQEEINSVKETFLGPQKDEEPGSEDDEEEDAITRARKPDINAYAAKLQSAGYVDYANGEAPKPKTEAKVEVVYEEDGPHPYVIPPEEFDEEGYELVCFTYYADGVLVNDRGDIVKDVEDILGIDPEEHFGEYEEDSVFVRDDEKRIDYEILRDPSNYWGAE